MSWWGWPILLDKGILGVGAAFCAYLFGRALERYRLASIYAQKLAERRIEAYDKVTEYLIAEGQSLNLLLARVEKTFASPDLGAEDLGALADGFREFTHSQSAPPPSIARELLYFSHAVRDACTVYMLALSEFKEFLRTHKLGEDSVKVFRDRRLGITVANAAFEDALTADLARSPEPRRFPMVLAGSTDRGKKWFGKRHEDEYQLLWRRVRSYAHYRWHPRPDGLYEPQVPVWPGGSKIPPATPLTSELTGGGGPSREAERAPVSHGKGTASIPAHEKAPRVGR